MGYTIAINSDKKMRYTLLETMPNGTVLTWPTNWGLVGIKKMLATEKAEKPNSAFSIRPRIDEPDNCGNKVHKGDNIAFGIFQETPIEISVEGIAHKDRPALIIHECASWADLEVGQEEAEQMTAIFWNCNKIMVRHRNGVIKYANGQS